jgi:hypothetical protein
MDGSRDFSITGPPFKVQFSLVDQVTPPVYSRRILIFSREDDDYQSAVLALQAGLQSTVNEIPILAGQLGLTSTAWIIKNGNALLRIRDVDMSYTELQSNNYSETMLQADTLSSVPTIADPQNEWNICRIQANFIRGGLLLVISINHTAMDGYGITKVIEALARNCRVNPPKDFQESVVFERPSILSECKREADIKKLPSYSIVAGVPKLRQISADIVTMSFRLPLPALKALKIAASSEESWITTHDAVNALCWRTHAKGRYEAKLITDQDIARFAFPVQFRLLIDPPLPSNYIGNAVLMTQVQLPVKTLLGPNGLSLAAASIRAGVKNVDASYVDNFIAVAKSLDNPRQLKIGLMLEDPRTGFGSTTYKSFDHSTLDWDPVLGNFERLRLPYGVLGEGMSIILPVLSDKSWEVTVTLEKPLVDLFRTDEEFMTYMD